MAKKTAVMADEIKNDSIVTETTSDEQIRPRQNRTVRIFLFKETMPDGVTKRIVQCLDRSIPFAEHPQLIEQINIQREKIFAEDAALYQTRYMESIPTDNPEITVVFMVKINSVTGEHTGTVAFTPEEANRALMKSRSSHQVKSNKTEEDGSYQSFNTIGAQLASKQKEAVAN